MILEHLHLKDSTNNCDLPELTAQESQAAIRAEQIKRAKRLHCSPDAITISSAYADKIILLARERKKSNQLANEYWKKVDQGPTVIKHNVKEVYYNFIAKASEFANKPFIVDENNKQVIEGLCYYFANDPKASDYGLNLNKGLLLLGGVGVGKTLIMKAFCLNQNASFRLLRSRDISYQFADSGFVVVKQYSEIMSGPANIYGQNEFGICIDDLGTEEERKHYGDKANALTEIVLNRYDLARHNMTHITTNLNAKAIEQVYGLRVRSRMREMFNQVSFGINTPDRRK